MWRLSVELATCRAQSETGSAATRRGLFFIDLRAIRSALFRWNSDMNHDKRSAGDTRVANSEQQLTIWGRANSVNVQKVLWCLR
jgi:hypothetical protein